MTDYPAMGNAEASVSGNIIAQINSKADRRLPTHLRPLPVTTADAASCQSAIDPKADISGLT